MSADTVTEMRPGLDKYQAVRELFRSKKKIAIVGYTESRHEAPYDDPEWLVGGCNNLWKFLPMDKVDFWFDTHDPTDIRKDTEHENWLRSAKVPVIVKHEQPDWPTSVAYPRDAVEAQFPRYFTNTISQQIALILLLAHDTITDLGVYGVDMATTSEYGSQRPSVEFFLGACYGRGIRLHIPKTSDLLKAASHYGFEDDSPMRIKMQARLNEVSQRRQQLEGQMAQMRDGINQMRGAEEDLRYWLGVWMTPAAERDGSRKDQTGEVAEIGPPAEEGEDESRE